MAEMFSLLMRGYREARGVSLTGLARQLGPPYTSSYLSKVERGACVPSFDRALAIARALDIGMEEFSD